MVPLIDLRRVSSRFCPWYNCRGQSLPSMKGYDHLLFVHRKVQERLGDHNTVKDDVEDDTNEDGSIRDRRGRGHDCLGCRPSVRREARRRPGGWWKGKRRAREVEWVC